MDDYTCYDDEGNTIEPYYPTPYEGTEMEPYYTIPDEQKEENSIAPSNEKESVTNHETKADDSTQVKYSGREFTLGDKTYKEVDITLYCQKQYPIGLNCHFLL